MKKIIMIISLCMIFVLVTGCGRVAKLSNGKELIAKTSVKGITTDSLYNELKDRYAKEILVDLIDHAILDTKYPETAALIEKVNSQIDSIKQQTGDNFLKAIKAQWGFNSEEELFSYLELYVRKDLAVKDYLQKHLTDAEINDYYDTETVGDIRASHILIKSKATDSMTAEQKTAKEKEALAAANDIIQKLNKGEKFADLAKQYSEDTGSAVNGGDLGWFNKGQMDESFEQAAFALKKGEYTKTPVKSAYGYHIILKVDSKAKPSLKDAKASIKTTLANKKLENDATLGYKTLEEIRKDNKLVIYDSELKSLYDEYMKELKTVKAE